MYFLLFKSTKIDKRFIHLKLRRLCIMIGMIFGDKRVVKTVHGYNLIAEYNAYIIDKSS